MLMPQQHCKSSSLFLKYHTYPYLLLDCLAIVQHSDPWLKSSPTPSGIINFFLTTLCTCFIYGNYLPLFVLQLSLCQINNKLKKILKKKKLLIFQVLELTVFTSVSLALQTAPSTQLILRKREEIISPINPAVLHLWIHLNLLLF